MNVKALASSDILIEFLSEGKVEAAPEENKAAKAKGLPEDVEVEQTKEDQNNMRRSRETAL